MLTIRLLGGHTLVGVTLEIQDGEKAVYKKGDMHFLIPKSAIVCIEADPEAVKELLAAQGSPGLPVTGHFRRG